MKRKIIVFSTLLIMLYLLIYHFGERIVLYVINWDSKKEIHFRDEALDNSCGILHKDIWRFAESDGSNTVEIYVKAPISSIDTLRLKNFAICYFSKDTNLARIRLSNVYYKYNDDKYYTPIKCEIFKRKELNVEEISIFKY